MGDWLHGKIPAIYWIVVLLDCIFLHFDLPYVAITESLLMPLLLVYLMLKDIDIARPAGKFIFYIGLIFAFFGDVLQIVISNQTFFLISIIAFMLMHISYSISFYCLNRLHLKNMLFVVVTAVLILCISYVFLYFFGKEMGEMKPFIITYLFIFGTSISLAVNIAGNLDYRRTAVRYFIPATVILVVEHILLGLDLFYFNNNADVYAAIVVMYALAQYLMVKGVLQIYPHTVPEYV